MGEVLRIYSEGVTAITAATTPIASGMTNSVQRGRRHWAGAKTNTPHAAPTSAPPK